MDRTASDTDRAMLAQDLDGMTPFGVQEYHAARNARANSLDEAEEVLDAAEAGLDATRQDLKHARRVFEDSAEAPANYSDADREEVRERADAQLRQTETGIRHDVVTIAARCDALHTQLDAAARAASLPDMVKLQAEEAARKLPLYVAMLSGATDAELAAALDRARLEDVTSTTVATALAVRTILATRPTPSGDGIGFDRHSLNLAVDDALRDDMPNEVAILADRARDIAVRARGVIADMEDHRHQRAAVTVTATAGASAGPAAQWEAWKAGR